MRTIFKGTFIVFISIVLFLMGKSFIERDFDDSLYVEGMKAYQRGLAATHYEEKQKAFNEAFSLFNAASQKREDNSSLNRAIADTYFQFEKYGFAILYYEKALLHEPHNKQISLHIQAAQKKLGLSVDNTRQKKSWFSSPQGIIVQTEYFYAFPDAQSSRLQGELHEGVKVDIMEMSHDKNWLKLRRADGTIGYTLTHSIRMI